MTPGRRPGTRGIVIAGARSALSDRIERDIVGAGSAVHRIGRPDVLAAVGRTSLPASRAVLHVELPPCGGRELREFRRGLAAQAFALSRLMGARASILVVAGHRVDTDGSRLYGLGGMLTRMRAAAQQELALTVSVNALVLSGRVDDDTVSYRVLEAMRGRALPDSDFVIRDEDVRTLSISDAITEERS